MTVRHAFTTWCGLLHFVTQVIFQRLTNRAGCASNGCDTQLLKKIDGAPAHTTAQDDIRLLLMNIRRDLPGLMRHCKGVGDALRSGYFTVFHVHHDKEGGVSKVLGDGAFKPIVAFCGH